MEQAQILRKAMKGLGTDEAAIISVMSQHNFVQRAEIARQFQGSFGIDLDKELKKELSGLLETICRACFEEHYHFWAGAIKKTIKGLGTDEKNLIPLILLQSDQDTEALKVVYREMFNKEMVKDINDDIGNSDWARLLRAWMAGQNTNTVEATLIADQLHQAAKGAGTDEDVFIRIMCTTTPECYRAGALAYAQKYGKALEKTIKAEFSGKSEYAFLMAHHYLMSPAEGVAFALYHSMKGAGTNEELLTNVTALFCDYFKGDAIKKGYAPFGDVTKDLKGDLSGKAEKAFLALWGCQK